MFLFYLGWPDLFLHGNNEWTAKVYCLTTLSSKPKPNNCDSLQGKYSIVVLNKNAAMLNRAYTEINGLADYTLQS